MTEEIRSADMDQVADAAAEWFVRLQDEAATGDDWLAFEAWLQASPAHQAAYDHAERLWIELDESAAPIAAALPVLEARSPGARRTRPIQPATRLSRRGWLAGAAAMAASIAVGVGVATWPTADPPFQVYSTRPGETREVALADGTHITMNAASTLRVSLGRDARRVEMADAEAVFDVAHDPSRPFLITAGDRQVRVVGTEFNLRRRAALMVLTVRRGIVEVRPIRTAHATPTRVMVGQQMTHADGSSAAMLTTTNPDQAFAWTNGQLIYQQQPLSEVAADLSRRFAKPVRLSDPALGRVRFSGVLITDNEAGAIRRLEAFASLRAEETKDAIVLHARQNKPRIP